MTGGGRAAELVSLAVAVLAATSGLAGARSYVWDRPANIADAAKRLVVMHRAKGSEGVTRFLSECYRTHMLASKFGKGLEACIAQDYIHTQALILVYSRMPPEAQQKMGIPSPHTLGDGLNKRFITVLQQYKMTTAEADELKRLMDKHGTPVFVKATFPAAANTPVPPDKPKN